MPSTNSPESAFESDSEASARVITEDIEKPSLDERSYLYHSLSNMARFLLVHDPNTVEAAVCVSVGAGLFNDPIGGKGIAHAVEHVSDLAQKCTIYFLEMADILIRPVIQGFPFGKQTVPCRR